MHRSLTHWWCLVRLQAGRYSRPAMSLPVGSIASMMGAAYSSRPALVHNQQHGTQRPLVSSLRATQPCAAAKPQLCTHTSDHCAQHTGGPQPLCLCANSHPAPHLL